MGAIQESINQIGKSALEATVAKGAKRLSEAEKIRSAGCKCKSKSRFCTNTSSTRKNC